MKHEITFNEKTGMVRINVKGEATLSDIIESFDAIDELIKDREQYLLLIDLRESAAVFAKKVRDELQRKLDGEKISKLAVIETNPMIRMFAKVVTSVRKKTKPTAFVRTEEEALDWLKKG